MAAVAGRRGRTLALIATVLGLIFACSGGALVWLRYAGGNVRRPAGKRPRLAYKERKAIDTSGFMAVLPTLPRWKESASLEDVREAFRGAGQRDIAQIDANLAMPSITEQQQIVLRLVKAAIYQYGGDPKGCSQALEETRAWLEGRDALEEQWLYSVIFFQGVSAMRLGENENCILCRGESSCIVPISAAAVHTKPDGSRAAIGYFTEYLEQFPEDIGVKWLLNVAHMTLGEYPVKVDARFRLDLDGWLHSSAGIGKFRDVGHLLGLNRLNQAGGAIMDDFDGDSLLDVVVTTMDPAGAMGFYHNLGDGRFEDRSARAGVTGQLGGLVCYQTDFNNDGRLDVFIPRGAWLPYPVRPSLLRNDGEGRFADVTAEAGLAGAVNSIAAAWADYDNDGWLDVFVACEKQPNRLFHNRRDGPFEDVAARAGLAGEKQEYKGCTWIDHDNDRYPDLFVSSLSGVARLFHNNRDGSFADVTGDMGIDGPRGGFACWSWDYDNDGWLDIFATSYDRTLNDVVRGLVGRTHSRVSSRLFRNKAGKGFENTLSEAGLDMVFATMGCNFGDFDNDGWLDFYLGTGDPDLSTLVPNRMFRNRSGVRFEEITGSSGTGHLQKGHGVACGDWDNDGDVDIFIEMGGALDGDKYHNIMFQNPGQGNNWITVKLVGKQTNRAAIGARIKVVTGGNEGLTIYRHVNSGSSFGANPLRQTIGVGKAGRIAEVQIDWPTSATTQVFRDLAVNQAIEITEFEKEYKSLRYPVIALPE
jgi:hypothetical protein